MITQSNWKLGVLAAAVETKYGDSSLARYAEDIGVSYDTLKHCRRVSKAYPPEKVPRGTFVWTVYKALAAQPDRLELLASRTDWTKSEAEQLVASRKPKPDSPKPRPRNPEPPKPRKPEPPDPPPTPAAAQSCG